MLFRGNLPIRHQHLFFLINDLLGLIFLDLAEAFDQQLYLFDLILFGQLCENETEFGHFVALGAKFETANIQINGNGFDIVFDYADILD